MARRKQVFDNFDEFASDYRSIHNDNIKFSGATSDEFSKYKIREVFNSIGITMDLNILDLGCGDGNSAVFFKKYFPDSKIHGLDISDESIRVAQERTLQNCTFQTYDGFTIPYPDSTFHIVFIACVLHHVDTSHHLALINECKRVLKKGGSIYVFEHNPWNPVTRRVVELCPFDEDALLLNSTYARHLIQSAGFHRHELRYTIFFPRKRVTRHLVPFEKYLWWLPLGGQYYIKSVKG